MSKCSMACVYVNVVRVHTNRYKFAELEAKLAMARLLQQYTFEPVAGEVPRLRTGITWAPDKVVLRVTRRKTAKEV